MVDKQRRQHYTTFTMRVRALHVAYPTKRIRHLTTKVYVYIHTVHPTVMHADARLAELQSDGGKSFDLLGREPNHLVRFGFQYPEGTTLHDLHPELSGYTPNKVMSNFRHDVDSYNRERDWLNEDRRRSKAADRGMEHITSDRSWQTTHQLADGSTIHGVAIPLPDVENSQSSI